MILWTDVGNDWLLRQIYWHYSSQYYGDWFIDIIFFYWYHLHTCSTCSVVRNIISISPSQLPFQEDDSASIAAANAAGTASPLTARSMRLERVAHALAQSQEELLKYVENFIFFTGFDGLLFDSQKNLLRGKLKLFAGVMNKRSFFCFISVKFRWRVAYFRLFISELLMK